MNLHFYYSVHLGQCFQCQKETRIEIRQSSRRTRYPAMGTGCQMQNVTWWVRNRVPSRLKQRSWHLGQSQLLMFSHKTWLCNNYKERKTIMHKSYDVKCIDSPTSISIRCRLGSSSGILIHICHRGNSRRSSCRRGRLRSRLSRRRSRSGGHR